MTRWCKSRQATIYAVTMKMVGNDDSEQDPESDLGASGGAASAPAPASSIHKRAILHVEERLKRARVAQLNDERKF